MELNLKILKKEKEKASLVCQGACGGGFHVLRWLDQEMPTYLAEYMGWWGMSGRAQQSRLLLPAFVDIIPSVQGLNRTRRNLPSFILFTWAELLLVTRLEFILLPDFQLHAESLHWCLKPTLSVYVICSDSEENPNIGYIRSSFHEDVSLNMTLSLWSPSLSVCVCGVMAFS